MRCLFSASSFPCAPVGDKRLHSANDQRGWRYHVSYAEHVSSATALEPRVPGDNFGIGQGSTVVLPAWPNAGEEHKRLQGYCPIVGHALSRQLMTPGPSV
jgi:hypothetical protein